MTEFLEEMEPLAEEMRKQVLAELEQRVTPLVAPPWDELRQQIIRLDAVLQEANGWRAKDRQGTVYLKVACTVLAIYRTLLPCFQDKQALLAHIKAVIDLINFQGGMDAFLLDHFGISPEHPDEALGANLLGLHKKESGKVREWLGRRARHQGRPALLLQLPQLRGFADFFLDNDAREVLYLFCATDYIWGDALEKYGITF